jgi:hypothetical protein
LNGLVRVATLKGLLLSFEDPCIKERVFFYADDVVLFVSPSQQDLVIVSTILDIFGGTSGLLSKVLNSRLSI